MNKEFFILLGMLMVIGLGTAVIVFSHDDNRRKSVGAAEGTGADSHVGVVQSKDSFYGQHSPSRMPTADALLAKWEAWKRLGVLASEMEASTLFTVGASLSLRTGAVFLCVWNQERHSMGLDTDAAETHDTDLAIRAAIEAIKTLIQRDKNSKKSV